MSKPTLPVEYGAPKWALRPIRCRDRGMLELLSAAVSHAGACNIASVQYPSALKHWCLRSEKSQEEIILADAPGSLNTSWRTRRQEDGL